MSLLPEADTGLVLDRVAAAINPDRNSNFLVLGKSGAGKTMLMRAVLARTAYADRVVAVDPKPADDRSWTVSSDELGQAPKAVTTLDPGFGQGREGGGPAGLWFRLVASRDPAVTARRFDSALTLIGREGACVVVLDDARTLAKSLGLADTLEDRVFLGRSARLSCIISTQDLGYIPIRAQTTFRFLGHTGSLSAAKAGCNLLGVRGAAWEDQLARLRPGEWIYHDDMPGCPGPVLFRSWQP